MTGPLQGGKPADGRKTTEEKVTAIYDLVGILLRALLSIFGKRKTDGL